jgi:hypothetical protein
MVSDKETQRRPVDFSADVAAILQDGDRREAERKQPRKQTEQMVEQDQKRPRISVDMPAWLQDEVRALAKAEHAGLSTTVCWLVMQGLQAYKAGAEPEKAPARSLKADYNLVIAPEDLEPCAET